MDQAKNAEFITVLKSIPTQPFEPPKQAYLHKEFEQHKAALIGLDRLVEVHCASDGFEPGYVCMLCEKLCHVTDVLWHVASKHHRRLYLDSVKNTFDPSSAALFDRRKVKTDARIYEELNPRKKVGLMLTKSFDKVLLGCRQLPSARIDDPTIACKPPQLKLAALELHRIEELATKQAANLAASAQAPRISCGRWEARHLRRWHFKEDLLRKPMKRFGPTEKCFAHVGFESYFAALVGLEAVIEMQPKEERYQPGYLCQTCVSRFESADSTVRHLTSAMHRFTYLSLPQHVVDLELNELLKCGPEDKVGLAKAAEHFERKNGRQCVSLTFEERFDHTICNALRRKADPSNVSASKRARARKKQQRAVQLVGNRKRKADNKNAPSGAEIQEKCIDEEVASKKIKEEPLPAPGSGTFQIFSPAPVASKPYVGLFPPKSAMTWKAAGDFSITKRKISDHEGGLVGQGVVQQTDRRSWDALAGQFLSGFGVSSSIGSSAVASAAFRHPLSVSGPFQSSQSNTVQISSVSPTHGMHTSHPFIPVGATMKVPETRGASLISSRLFPGIVTTRSSIGAPQAPSSKPRFGFFSRPTFPVAPQVITVPATPTIAIFSPISSAAVSTSSKAMVSSRADSLAPQVTAVAKPAALSKTSVLSSHLPPSAELTVVSKPVFSAPQLSPPAASMAASKSDSLSARIIPATDATMAGASKIGVSAPELDDLSLVNDAAATVDAALHECSAEELMQLLVKEKEAAESRDRLITKLANELLAKQSG